MCKRRQRTFSNTLLRVIHCNSAIIVVPSPLHSVSNNVRVRVVIRSPIRPTSCLLPIGVILAILVYAPLSFSFPVSESACRQTITLPAISVWTCCPLPNGDIVVGSSDGVVRVFTSQPDRYAPEEDLVAFQTQVPVSSEHLAHL